MITAARNSPDNVWNNVSDTDFSQFSAAAYENVHGPVFHAWLMLPFDKKLDAIRNQYTFYSVCFSLPNYLAEQTKIDVQKTTTFVTLVCSLIDGLVTEERFKSPEWFEGLEKLAVSLTDLNYIAHARHLVAQALRAGVGRYPRLHQSFKVQIAYLDALVGHPHKSTDVALNLVRRPYLLPSRKELPSMCLRLMHILAKSTRFREYRLVMWTGVSSLNASKEQRDIFTSQIIKTYRGSWRALLHADVPLKFRIPFFFLVPARALSGWRVTGALGLDEPFRWVHICALYVLDRLLYRKNELFQHANREATALASQAQHKRRLRLGPSARRILVTRAMGGLGDVLMMTPALRAMSQKFPNAIIHFALPSAFHPLLVGLDRIECLAIDNAEINLSLYHRWINLTDCPASRVESRQYPNVRTNRIDIFAKAMGISRWELKRYGGLLPHYKVLPDELKEAREHLSSVNPTGLQVVAIQPYSVDSYRNWPHMTELAKALAEKHCVLIFHNETLREFEGSNIHALKLPIRKAAALMSLANHLVAPDSVFIHLAPALGLSTTAIFGPISGRVRCKDYPLTNLLRPKKSEFPCSPCWRNEHMVCHLTQGRESICMRSITVGDVLESIKSDARYKTRMRGVFSQGLSWLRYGTE